MTKLLQLQGALDEMRQTYDEVLTATESRLDRIGEMLLNTGATLHATADDYDNTDREVSDWLAATWD